MRRRIVADGLPTRCGLVADRPAVRFAMTTPGADSMATLADVEALIGPAAPLVRR
jgi:hypothetical protein